MGGARPPLTQSGRSSRSSLAARDREPDAETNVVLVGRSLSTLVLETHVSRRSLMEMTESQAEAAPAAAKALLALNPEQESEFKKKVQQAKKSGKVGPPSRVDSSRPGGFLSSLNPPGGLSTQLRTANQTFKLPDFMDYLNIFPIIVCRRVFCVFSFMAI